MVPQVRFWSSMLRFKDLRRFGIFTLVLRVHTGIRKTKQEEDERWERRKPQP